MNLNLYIVHLIYSFKTSIGQDNADKIGRNNRCDNKVDGIGGNIRTPRCCYVAWHGDSREGRCNEDGFVK